jgi:hypothetical protein
MYQSFAYCCSISDSFFFLFQWHQVREKHNQSVTVNLFDKLFSMILLGLDVKNKARSINNIIASLPFTSDIKKKLFDLTVGLLKRTIQLDNAIDEFRKLQFVLDHPMKQSSYETVII